MTTKAILPFDATHPGTLLLEELRARKIKQIDLAAEIGVLPTFLNEIIRGKRPITADLAILLEKTLEIPADFWMRFQSQYDIDKARLKEKNVRKIELLEIWNIVKEYVPVKSFKKHGYIGNSLEENISTIKDIYQVNSVDGLINTVAQHQAVAFYRKSDKLQIERNNMLGWSKLAEYEASKIELKEFDFDTIDTLKKELQIIFFENKNVRNRTQSKLKEYGIKLVYIPRFEKAPVDGFSFWSGDNPVIALTLRHKRIDNFAFNVFHELGHIDLHLREEKERRFLDIIGAKNADKYEQQADNYAQKTLISENQWVDLVNNYIPLSDIRIYEFANKYGINPAIILGRACYEMNYYAIKSDIDKKLN